MRTTRPGRREDAAAVARIYSEGIEDRQATFETEPRSAADVEPWFDAFPVVVLEEDGEVVAFASAPPASARECYAGVREFSVYVRRDRRGGGRGAEVMRGLVAECRRRGHWKLLSRVFPENAASRALCRSLGFREVGVHRRHARLDGEWRDCVLVELLLDGGSEAG